MKRTVTVAKTAGFCFGVRRAVDLVYEKLDEGARPIYTYGPIIHNAQVVGELEGRGVRVIESADDLSDLPPGRVIIRSHGIGREEYEHLMSLEAQGFEIFDATCPFVRKIHDIVSDYSSRGYAVIVAGDESHPEVRGILGWVEADAPAFTVNCADDVRNLPDLTRKKACMVAQTTFNRNKFQDLVEIVRKIEYDICVLDTICGATGDRQSEAREIARRSEAMIVIGDRHSSNTQKLFEICSKECENTYYIQTSDEMDYGKLESINNVGITAGASTPNKIIEEVSKNVRDEL